MNPLEPNIYEILVMVLGALFVIAVIWALVLVIKNFSKKSYCASPSEHAARLENEFGDK